MLLGLGPPACTARRSAADPGQERARRDRSADGRTARALARFLGLIAWRRSLSAPARYGAATAMVAAAAGAAQSLLGAEGARASFVLLPPVIVAGLVFDRGAGLLGAALAAASGLARPDGKVFWCNRRWCDYAGTTPGAEVPAGALLRLLDPEHAEGVASGWARAVASGRPWEDTCPMRAADGSRRWFLSRAEPVRDAAGLVALWFGMHTDVTSQREAEERRRVLVAELNHRVKNTLATVQSIARQTARGAPKPEAFVPAFEARLLALAAAHDLLTRRGWTGATVADVVRRSLAPHLASGRVSVSGPEDMRDGPRAAVALAMAVGELAANAARHGALTARGGSVAVEWRCGDGDGVLTWEERGGPPLL